MKVWVYVSEKHSPEVFYKRSDALHSLLEDARSTLDELLESGYATVADDGSWVSVEDTGSIEEVEVQ